MSTLKRRKNVGKSNKKDMLCEFICFLCSQTKNITIFAQQ